MRYDIGNDAFTDVRIIELFHTHDSFLWIVITHSSISLNHQSYKLEYSDNPSGIQRIHPSIQRLHSDESQTMQFQQQQPQVSYQQLLEQVTQLSNELKTLKDSMTHSQDDSDEDIHSERPSNTKTSLKTMIETAHRNRDKDALFLYTGWSIKRDTLNELFTPGLIKSFAYHWHLRQPSKEYHSYLSLDLDTLIEAITKHSDILEVKRKALRRERESKHKSSNFKKKKKAPTTSEKKNSWDQKNFH
jgi:hypothetical protein